MTKPAVTYLAMDSVGEGAGASQVIPYVDILARLGFRIHLHTFEKTRPEEVVRDRLTAAGVDWTPHPFGRHGPAAGLRRVLRAAGVLRAAPDRLVHARSDLAAAAALLGHSERWIWDVRSFWADHRIDMGLLRRGTPEERILRHVEAAAAERSTAIVTLAAAAIPVLAQRFGDGVAQKACVIPTCVDLERFSPAPLPAPEPLRFLLSGSLSPYYDVPAMLALVRRARERGETEFVVLSRGPSMWDEELGVLATRRGAAAPWEVPTWVQAANVGLSVCRSDVGISRHAAMPTKIGEFLAMGRPVVVNPGLGDMDAIIERYHCGVHLRGTERAHLDETLEGLGELLRDPELALRCRAAAEEHFSLELGVRRLAGLYRSAGATGSGS